MIAQAILGPGDHGRNLQLRRSADLRIVAANELRCKADTDLIIVLGGDGTIHRFLPELVRCRKPILIIPTGSGNDLARALGIHSAGDGSDLASVFVRGNAAVREIDVGLIIDSNGAETPFCCTAGVGLDAAAGEFANRMPRWLRGHGGYLIAAMNGIRANPKMELRISAGSGSTAKEIERTACLFTMANTPSFGGGLPIAPAARLDDGEFDCVLADAMSRARLARAALSLLHGTHLQLPEVHFMRASSVRVDSNPPVTVYADGEFVCETPVDVRVLPKALRVCTAIPV